MLRPLSIAAFGGRIDDPGQVPAGEIADRTAGKDQASLAFIDVLEAITVAAIVEWNKGFAGDVSTLVGRVAGNINDLLDWHANLKFGKRAARYDHARDLSLPIA